MLVRISDQRLHTDVCDDDVDSLIYFIRCDDLTPIQQYFSITEPTKDLGSNMDSDTDVESWTDSMCTWNPELSSTEDEYDPMRDPHYPMRDPHYITRLDYYVYEIGSIANKRSGLETEEERQQVCDWLAATDKKGKRGMYVSYIGKCTLCMITV